MTVPTDANPPILDRHVAGCFYCGRFGPYTAEHVVSAGLGGDDPAWMLRECVCTFCNNQTFSRMETHVFKASYIALMRLFSQPTTRDGTPPAPLQAPTTVQLGDDGPHAAGDFGAGGQAGVFAQILFETTDAGDISFPLIGPDRPSVNALLAALRERLHDEVVVIEKHHARSFTTTTLTWTSDRYQAGASVPVQKPPAAGIWFEPEYVPATADAPPPWTVFRRPTGQLIGRAPDLAHLTGLLSELRPYLDEIVRAFGNASIESSNAQPGVHIGMTTELHTVERVCVKIGLNLTAHLFDVDVVRGADFDAAVAFVLGQGEPVRRAQLPPETLGAPLKGRHVFFLTPCRAPSGRLALVLIMRLYDVGPVDSFVLAEFADAMPLVQSVVVHVDYAADSIDYMSLDEHQLRCSAPQGEVHDP